MLTVLMTTDTVGGVWTYAIELARALAEEDVRVVLATMGAPLRDDQREQVDAAGLEVHESEYRLEWMADPWDDVDAAGDWLLELADAIGPDVVHLNGYAHGALPWGVPTLVVAHSCVCSWWRAVHGEPAPAEWHEYRRRVMRGLGGADLVLAPTWAMLRALQACHGPVRRSGVVPNGRRADLFPPRDKQPFVFAAGRLWDPAKNLAALNAVADRLSWPVHVAGDTCAPGSEAKVAVRVRGLGRLTQREVAAQMGRAAIYAHPARYEPFGLSVLEAAMAGCALVLGDIPTLRELWHDDALVVPPNDHEALAQVLQELIDDAPRREAMARRARSRALQWTPRRMAVGYRRAYDRLRERRERNAPCVS